VYNDTYAFKDSFPWASGHELKGTEFENQGWTVMAPIDLSAAVSDAHTVSIH
jgi:hypothetical protein